MKKSHNAAKSTQNVPEYPIDDPAFDIGVSNSLNMQGTIRHIIVPAEAVPSPSKQACEEFMWRVRRIAGVARAEVRVGKADEYSILVAVPSLFSKTTDHVIDLETKIRRKYSDARLRIDIKGLEERHILPEDAANVDLW